MKQHHALISLHAQVHTPHARAYKRRGHFRQNKQAGSNDRSCFELFGKIGILAIKIALDFIFQVFHRINYTT